MEHPSPLLLRSDLRSYLGKYCHNYKALSGETIFVFVFSLKHQFDFFFFFSVMPTAWGSSQAKDQTWARAVMTPGPLTARSPGNSQHQFVLIVTWSHREKWVTSFPPKNLMYVSEGWKVWVERKGMMRDREKKKKSQSITLSFWPAVTHIFCPKSCFTLPHWVTFLIWPCYSLQKLALSITEWINFNLLCKTCKVL